MLAHNSASAVVVSTDLERSQRFYEEKVGLTLLPGDHQEPSALRLR